MGLPPYTGPYKVGVIDLEIPVRKPRSFCDNVVSPGDLNKPSRKARDKAKKLNREAKKRRQSKEGELARNDLPAESSSQTQSPSARTTPNSTTATSSNEQVSEQGQGKVKEENDNHDDEEQSSWSPWSSGAKTCTLHLETVLFTIYYPTSVSTEEEERKYPRAAWLGRPIHAGVQALFQYVGQYGIFAIPASPAVITLIRARMPARAGPPLLDPEVIRKRAHPQRSSTDDDRATTGNFGQRPPQFPVVIFSHGLAGNRLSYSQYCAELASQGIIVAAIEHRDGSGVSSIVRGEEAPSQSEQQADSAGAKHHKLGGGLHRGSGRPKASVPYFSFEKIGLHSFSEDPSEREIDLRKDQIEMRHAEIEETLYVLNEINQGRGYQIYQRSTRTLGTKLAGKRASAKHEGLPKESIIKAARPLEDWANKMDLEYPTLCGHSFGGATVLELMRKPNPFPFAIVLDPWVEPVRDPMEPEGQVVELRKPIYVLNSESFTVWESHFNKLKRICMDARKSNDEKRGWLMTLCGSKHTDFSDYPFLLPKMFRSTVGPKKTIEVFVKATYMQMGLSRQRFREKENKPGVKIDRRGTLSDDGREHAHAAERDQTKGEEEGEGRGRGQSIESRTESGQDAKGENLAGAESKSRFQAPSAEMEAFGSMEQSATGSGSGILSTSCEHGQELVQSPLAEGPTDGEEEYDQTGTGDAGYKGLASSALGWEEASSGKAGVKQKPSFGQTKGQIQGKSQSGMAFRENAETLAATLRAGANADTPPTMPKKSEVSSGETSQKQRDLQQDQSDSGQKARDQLAANHRRKGTSTSQAQDQAIKPSETAEGEEQHKDFITDVRYLQMVDHDQDVEQVHRVLEDISQSLAHKKRTKPRSLMSIFLYYNGMKPGLDRPGQVLIHQLDADHPPK